MELGLSIGNMYFKVEREDIGPVSGIGTLYCMISSLFSRLRHYHLICVPAQKHFFSQDFHNLSKQDLERCQTALQLKEKDLEQILQTVKNLKEEEAKLSQCNYSNKIKELNVRISFFFAKRALLINAIVPI